MVLAWFGQPDEDEHPQPEVPPQPTQPGYGGEPDPIADQPIGPPGFQARESTNSTNDVGPTSFGYQQLVENYQPGTDQFPPHQMGFYPEDNPLNQPGVYNPLIDQTRHDQTTASAFDYAPGQSDQPGFNWQQLGQWQQPDRSPWNPWHGGGQPQPDQPAWEPPPGWGSGGGILGGGIGGGALSGLANAAQSVMSLPPQVGEIPGVTPFIQNEVRPAVAHGLDIAERGGFNPIGIAANQLGAPDILTGGLATQLPEGFRDFRNQQIAGLIPSTGGEAGLLALPFAGKIGEATRGLFPEADLADRSFFAGAPGYQGGWNTDFQAAANAERTAPSLAADSTHPAYQAGVQDALRGYSAQPPVSAGGELGTGVIGDQAMVNDLYRTGHASITGAQSQMPPSLAEPAYQPQAPAQPAWASMEPPRPTTPPFDSEPFQRQAFNQTADEAISAAPALPDPNALTPAQIQANMAVPQPGYASPVGGGGSVPPPQSVSNLSPAAGNGPGMQQFGAQGAGGPPSGGVPPTGGTGVPTPPSGPPSQNALQQLGRMVKEAAYFPFGGDIGTPLRQDIGSTLNPLKIGQTVEVGKLASRMSTSPAEAASVMDELRNLPLTKAMEARGVHINLPDITGSGPVSGRETMVSQLGNAIPGYGATQRANGGWVAARRALEFEDFLERNPRVSGAQAQTAANYFERFTGRGDFGPMNEAASKLGPLFTSLRYSASLPQSASYLLPWTRLADGSMEIFGPVWQQAVKDHAGFIASGLAALKLADEAGAKVDWSKGQIGIGNTHVSLWGGAQRYINLVANLMNDQKPPIFGENSRGQYGGSVAEFIRNQGGPILGMGAAGAKAAGVNGKGIDFIRPDYWDKGVLGKGTWEDKVAQYVVPLWMQDVAQAVQNAAKGNETTAGAIAAPLSFFGAGVQSYPQSKSSMGQEALDDPAKLSAAFPNSPSIQGALKGKDWAELLPTEKSALVKTLDPELRQQIEAQSRQNNPAIAAHGDALDALKQSRTTTENQLLDSLNSGKMTGYNVRDAMKAANETYYTAKSKLDADPAFQKELASIKSGSSPSLAQQALDNYFIIQNRTADDPARQRAEEAKYLQFVHSQDPQLADRIVTAIQGEPKTGLEKLYADAKPILAQAFDPSKSPADRTAERKANPVEDAILNYLGYERNLLTPEAARLVEQMRRQGVPSAR